MCLACTNCGRCKHPDTRLRKPGECPACGTENKATAARCAGCGAPLCPPPGSDSDGTR